MFKFLNINSRNYIRKMMTFNENIWNIDDFNLTSVNILNQPEDDFFFNIKQFYQEETEKKLKSTYVDYFDLNFNEFNVQYDSSSDEED